MRDVVDPGQYVDREAEQEVFAELLRLDDERRLLLIADAEGSGKSAVLRRLHHNCRWGITPAEASLVQLHDDEVLDPRDRVSTPRDLVAKVRRDLARLPFPKFDKANVAYLSKQWQPPGFVATFDAGEGTTISGHAKAAAVIVEGDLHVALPVDWPSPEHELQAADACVTAFLDDLRALTAEQTVVLLLDSYERCERGLREWLLLELIKRHCLDDGRPERFVVVMAGHEQHLPTLTSQQHRFASRKLLGWSEEHVREFLALYDFQLTPTQLDHVVAEVLGGESISYAYGLAVYMEGNRRQKAGAR